MEVPPDWRRDLVIGAGRPTECYERALEYTMNHADHDVVLVHGLVLERGRLWPHAWAAIGGGAVYDSTTGEFYDRASYHEVLQVVVVGVFTPEQAASRATAEGGAGPWGAYSQGQPGYVLALEATASLSDSYAATYPELAAWVRRMREHDDRFARDLAALMRSDLLAIGDLLASLVERPDLWRSRSPGAPWPYRLHKHPDHARVIFPEVPEHRNEGRQCHGKTRSSSNRISRRVGGRRCRGERSEGAGTVASEGAQEAASASRVASAPAPAAPAAAGRVPSRAEVGAELQTGGGGGASTGDILAAALPIVGLPAIGAAAFWAGGSLLETPGERAGRRAKDPGRMALLRWSLEQAQNPYDMPADQRAYLEATIGGPWVFRGEDAPMPASVRKYLEENRGAPEIANLLALYDRSGRRKRNQQP
jgi:hypothetical protein